MNLKIFQIAVLLMLVIFSLSGIAILLSAIFTLFSPSPSGEAGISALAGGVSINLIRLVVSAAVFMLVVIFAFWRWRVFRN